MSGVDPTIREDPATLVASPSQRLTGRTVWKRRQTYRLTIWSGLIIAASFVGPGTVTTAIVTGDPRHGDPRGRAIVVVALPMLEVYLGYRAGHHEIVIAVDLHIVVVILIAILFVLLWTGSYRLIEKVLMVMVGALAVIFIVTAIVVRPDLVNCWQDVYSVDPNRSPAHNHCPDWYYRGAL